MRDESGYEDYSNRSDQTENVLVRPYIPPDQDFGEAAGYTLPEAPPEMHDPNAYDTASFESYPAGDYPADGYPAESYPVESYPVEGYPADGQPADAFPAEDYPDRPYQDDAEHTGPVFVPDPTPMTMPGDSDREPPVSHVHPESDRRQMVWLIGSGLALVIAVAVTMIALWPAHEEETPTAADRNSAAPTATAPGSPQGSAPGGAPSAGPSKGAAAPATTGTRAANGTTTQPGTQNGTTVPNFPLPPAGNGQGNNQGNGQQQPAPPPATLAPPPAADRTGPVVAASGNCLDIDAGIILFGDELVARDCNNTSSQKYTLAKDGTLRVSGSCAVQEGAEIKVRACGSGAAAGDAGQWRAGPGNSLVNNGSKQCVTANDSDVSLASCGGNGQAWTLP
ncbi:ricin-type beta-trefoil lectin domain protein [Actinoplanes sp. NPDC049265]|uniref:ricin-type beta-trefoil lectin domain protein n=1 Tax=Actinoplanes sp. NPDC049265 TaxID=3363902 RepID=UPI00371E1ACF